MPHFYNNHQRLNEFFPQSLPREVPREQYWLQAVLSGITLSAVRSVTLSRRMVLVIIHIYVFCYTQYQLRIAFLMSHLYNMSCTNTKTC